MVQAVSQYLSVNRLNQEGMRGLIIVLCMVGIEGASGSYTLKFVYGESSWTTSDSPLLSPFTENTVVVWVRNPFVFTVRASSSCNFTLSHSRTKPIGETQLVEPSTVKRLYDTIS